MYHIDGIGTLSDNGNGSYIVVDHNTIVSRGNTNGIAFQKGVYDHVTITRNLLGGFGYTVALWAPGTNTTFTDNVYTTQIRPDWGPLYGQAFWEGAGSVWARNRWAVPPGADGRPGTSWLVLDPRRHRQQRQVRHTIRQPDRPQSLSRMRHPRGWLTRVAWRSVGTASTGRRGPGGEAITTATSICGRPGFARRACPYASLEHLRTVIPHRRLDVVARSRRHRGVLASRANSPPRRTRGES